MAHLKMLGPEWYTDKINRQTLVRIRLAKAAYSYECLNENLISDAEFDTLAREVDLSVDTRRPDLDDFFRKEFSPDTGMWIYKHPDLDIIRRLVENSN